MVLHDDSGISTASDSSLSFNNSLQLSKRNNNHPNPLKRAADDAGMEYGNS